MQGSLDIMVQRSGSNGAAREIVFIKNNYFHDAFFLKALGEPRSFPFLLGSLRIDSLGSLAQCSTAHAQHGANRRSQAKVAIE